MKKIVFLLTAPAVVALSSPSYAALDTLVVTKYDGVDSTAEKQSGAVLTKDNNNLIIEFTGYTEKAVQYGWNSYTDLTSNFSHTFDFSDIDGEITGFNYTIYGTYSANEYGSANLYIGDTKFDNKSFVVEDRSTALFQPLQGYIESDSPSTLSLNVSMSLYASADWDKVWNEEYGEYENIYYDGRVDMSISKIVLEPVVSEVPLPAAAWLFSAALVGLAGFHKRN